MGDTAVPSHRHNSGISGLQGLKRAWSGSAHDLGEDGDEVNIAPTKAQRRMKENVVPASSPLEHIDVWETTPPEKQIAIRKALQAPRSYAALSQKPSIEPYNVFKPDITEPASIEDSMAMNAGQRQLAGVRVSGLARSFTRTHSQDLEANQSAISKVASSSKTKLLGSSSTADNAERLQVSSHKSSSSSSSSSLSSSSTSSRLDVPQLSTTTQQRSLPPGFASKSKQQLTDERRRNGKVPSFFAKQPANEKTTSASSLNPDDEYKEKEATVPGMFRLSAQQLRVRNLVVEEGSNVFFTGSAGTGKSVLLRDIIKLLKKKYAKRDDAVATTASTGIAACNIGGVTLHSFAGVGLGNESFEALLQKIKKNRKAVGRWARTQVLIIDEISMVEPALLDKLEHIARSIRRSEKPFGGIQIVITGDFFQLPPVTKSGETRFAFEAEMWDKVLHYKVNLTEVFRQKDQTFVRMLNEMRHGKLSQDSITRFSQLSREPNFDPNIVPTQLFPHRNDVDKANQSRLIDLRVSGRTFDAKDAGELPPDQREKVLANFMAPQKLFLKIGAQVMLIKNLDETLVNGSIGQVVAFCDNWEYKVSLEKYSNLSDDKNLSNLRDDVHGRRMRELSPVKGAMNSTSARNTPEPNSEGAGKGRVGKSPAPMQQWPLVRFTQPGGGHRTELIIPETWKNELPNGEVQASRTQIPLILAWAMSIHKSQGQTIPCCRIDLGKVFEKGQAYVALSRATCLEGLQVLNFRPEKVMAHPRVIEWSKSLTSGGR